MSRRREKESDWQKVKGKIEQRQLSPEEHAAEMEKAKRRFSAEENRKLDAFYFRKNNPSKDEVGHSSTLLPPTSVVFIIIIIIVVVVVLARGRTLL